MASRSYSEENKEWGIVTGLQQVLGYELKTNVAFARSVVSRVYVILISLLEIVAISTSILTKVRKKNPDN